MPSPRTIIKFHHQLPRDRELSVSFRHTPSFPLSTMLLPSFCDSCQFQRWSMARPQAMPSAVGKVELLLHQSVDPPTPCSTRCLISISEGLEEIGQWQS